jgi:hypothetical protein
VAAKKDEAHLVPTQAEMGSFTQQTHLADVKEHGRSQRQDHRTRLPEPSKVNCGAVVVRPRGRRHRLVRAARQGRFTRGRALHPRYDVLHAGGGPCATALRLHALGGQRSGDAAQAEPLPPQFPDQWHHRCGEGLSGLCDGLPGGGAWCGVVALGVPNRSFAVMAFYSVQNLAKPAFGHSTINGHRFRSRSAVSLATDQSDRIRVSVGYTPACRCDETVITSCKGRSGPYETLRGDGLDSSDTPPETIAWSKVTLGVINPFIARSSKIAACDRAAAPCPIEVLDVQPGDALRPANRPSTVAFVSDWDDRLGLAVIGRVIVADQRPYDRPDQHHGDRGNNLLHFLVSSDYVPRRAE